MLGHFPDGLSRHEAGDDSYFAHLAVDAHRRYLGLKFFAEERYEEAHDVRMRICGNVGFAKRGDRPALAGCLP